MAIAFVAFAETTSTAASTMVVTLPTNSADDLIVIAFVHDYNSNTQQLSSMTDSYTDFADESTTGMDHQASVWYKKSSGSESNPTATYLNSTQEMAALAFSFSGVDTVTPIDVGPSAWTEEDIDTDQLIDTPSVTTVTDNAWMISVVSADDNFTYTKPTAMTLVSSHDFSNMCIAAAYEAIPSLGATGTRQWSWGSASDELAAVSFALRPAAGGANPKGVFNNVFAGPFGGPI